jgi:hypothetical protein
MLATGAGKTGMGGVGHESKSKVLFNAGKGERL